MSFGSQNINIITNKKAMTIRKLWKTPLKVGDRLHCYWNLASKEKKKIFEAQVTDVKTLTFKEIKNNDKLAQEEGYADSNEMVREFKKMYPDGISDDDLFQVIYFEKLDLIASSPTATVAMEADGRMCSKTVCGNGGSYEPAHTSNGRCCLDGKET